MSSSRIFYGRKRRSDDESSDSDSQGNVQPVKRLRLLTKELSTLPKYLLNIGELFTRKLSDVVKWLYKLPVANDNDRDSMLKSVLDSNVPIGVQEDLDVVEIHTEDEDDDIIIEEEYTHFSDKSSRRNNLHRNSISAPVVTHPVSSSTPLYRGQNGTRGRTLNSLSRLPVNGCKNGKTYNTRSAQKMRHRNSAPITNPSLDVEILLDTRETPSKEPDDLEIVSEVSYRRTSRRLARKTVLPANPKFYQASDYNGTSPGSVVNGEAASCNVPRSLSTAHQVFRLQEKFHYQLVLDKMIGTSTYRAVTPKKGSESPEIIKADIMEAKKPLIPTYFKKEVLEKPVSEFLQKYYKPCRFKSFESPKDNSNVEVLTIDDDDDQANESKSSDDYYKFRPNTKEPFFSSDWIEEFKKTLSFETEKQIQRVKAQEAKVDRYKKRRDAKKEREKILRGLSICSDQSEQDEFPELTPDMDDRIEWAFSPALSNIETLSTFKDCTCNRSDMQTLAGLNWLNDSVINFYLALVAERGKNHPVYPSVYAFNSYFYSSLKSRGPKAVMRWTRKIEDSKNIFQFDILFVPLHLGMHWALCVVDNRTQKIKYYDSMQGTDDQCLRILQNYLVVEKKEKLGIVMDPNAYSLEIVKDIPQQMNGSDCGMFTLKYAEYISRDAPITFSQEHMQYFRRRMVIEILDKKLF